MYSDADRAALHVQYADEAYHIGAAPATESYLNIARILEAARLSGATAIHPGYGFLSENPAFAEACADAGLTFIGPSAENMHLAGSKTAARRVAHSIGIPILSGTIDPVTDLRQAAEAALAAGFPVMIKAAAGGGGKGMRRVDSAEELEAALRDASSEAARAFGDGALFLEKYLAAPRHVEVQILADHYGHVIHLGERECSIQRRHQKIVEECPAPLVTTNPELRSRLGEAAVRLARALGYRNAGTIEFLVDDQGNFYFLEMNTRLQVEHPITEIVTGIDLVDAQLRIAAGEPLWLGQEDIAWRGSAIEFRIYAEDPDLNFLPAPGRIDWLELPCGPGVRVDNGVYAGWTVPLEYDPLLAKLICHGEDRASALRVAHRALDEYILAGVANNLSFFRDLVADEPFLRGELNTGFVDAFLRRRPAAEPAEEEMAVAALAAELAVRQRAACRPGVRQISRWTAEGRARLMR